MSRRTFAALLLAMIGMAGPPAMGQDAPQPPHLDRIRPSKDKTHFVREGTDDRFVIWGFNYDRDDSGRLLEDYWDKEWDTVAADFREMKGLGANVVRVHLQTGRFMADADHPDASNLERLGKLVRLAEETGLYLDVTGLGCYHKQDVPEWYSKMGESDRWAVQARFWKAVAGACRESPAIFCFDLMNEPIVGGGDDPHDWLPGKPLAGKHFVQRITTDARGRDDKEIARLWVETLTKAIRSADDRAMITVGVIPWAQVFKGARPLFESPEVGGPLEFASVHFYPGKGKLEDDLAALKAYEVGKPLVIEEIFPIHAGYDETATFIERSKPLADGWISFYWGKTIADYEKQGDLNGAVIAGWLRRFREMSTEAKKAEIRIP